MSTKRTYFQGFLLSFAVAAAAGCAPESPDEEDRGDELAAGDVEDAAELGEAEAAIASSDLSVLLMGSSKPVTQPYAPNGGHAGVDFGSTGDGITSVRSPIYGTITAKTSACGKVAIFDGTNTLIFAHMKDLTSLAVGTSVTTGTLLGKASQVIGGGCSASGPHLHVEIRTGNNTNMANPAANNAATTLNPLSYAYGPFAPVTLGTSTVAGNNVTFTWTQVQGASTYRLQVSKNGFSSDSCPECAQNVTLSGTQKVLTLSAAGVYKWRVRAGSSYSGGNWSSTKSFTK